MQHQPIRFSASDCRRICPHDAEPVTGAHPRRVGVAPGMRPSRRNCMPNIAPLWVDRWAIADEVAPAVVITSHFTRDSELFVPDSRQAWMRLALAVMIASVGAVGMWSVVVVMPVVQAEFSATRGAISLAATMIFFGFGLGGVIMGKITDRVRIVPAMAVSIALLSGAYVLAGLASALW